MKNCLRVILATSSTNCEPISKTQQFQFKCCSFCGTSCFYCRSIIYLPSQKVTPKPKHSFL